MPEFDREGRAVCQFWLQGGKHNVTPTDKNPSDESHPGDLLTPPPFLRKGGEYKVPRKNSLKRTHKRDSNLAKEEEILMMSPTATMGPALCKLSA